MADRGPRTLSEQLGPEKLNLVWILLTAWLAAFGVVMIVKSLRWPMVHDAPILIYMGFLTEHGMRLYRDVVEVQFPGSVLLYSIERHVFGPSDFGFRIFDLCGTAMALAAMLAIARRPRYWFAGVFGFAFFLWSHVGLSTSISNLGQRDFFLTCLLGAAMACLIAAMRREQPALMVVFGFCVAYAVGIKPPAVLFLLPLVLLVLEMRKRGRSSVPYLGWTVAGLAAGTALLLGYLLWQHALGAFLQDEVRCMPLYSGIAKRSMKVMLQALFNPRLLLPLMMLAGLALVAVQAPLRRDREQQVLLLCWVLGLVAFLAQHKGFDYHRTPFLFFFFLWMGWVLVSTMLEGRRELGYAALALTAVVAIAYPHFWQRAEYDLWLVDSLQSDLTAMHATDKPGDVQCVDVTFGCITVALRMQAVMATGYTQDYLMFLNKHDPRLDYVRADFLSHLEAARPRLVVLTNDQWPEIWELGYDKLKYWPEFTQYLNDDYTVALDRTSTVAAPGPGSQKRGYRIYVRKPGV